MPDENQRLGKYNSKAVRSFAVPLLNASPDYAHTRGLYRRQLGPQRRLHISLKRGAAALVQHSVRTDHASECTLTAHT